LQSKMSSVVISGGIRSIVKKLVTVFWNNMTFAGKFTFTIDWNVRMCRTFIPPIKKKAAYPIIMLIVN